MINVKISKLKRWSSKDDLSLVNQQRKIDDKLNKKERELFWSLVEKYPKVSLRRLMVATEIMSGHRKYAVLGSNEERYYPER